MQPEHIVIDMPVQGIATQSTTVQSTKLPYQGYKLVVKSVIVPVNKTNPNATHKQTDMITVYFLSSLMVLFLLAFPITEIVFGVLYQDVSCPSDIRVSLPVWLIVKGSVTILVFTMLIRKYNPILLHLFQFCWIIVGGVLFWRDCSGIVLDRSLYIMTTISLVLGIIGLCCGHQKSEK